MQASERQGFLDIGGQPTLACLDNIFIALIPRFVKRKMEAGGRKAEPASLAARSCVTGTYSGHSQAVRFRLRAVTGNGHGKRGDVSILQTADRSQSAICSPGICSDSRFSITPSRTRNLVRSP